MALTSDVIARFVKAATVEETKKPDTTVYGTIVDYEGRKYVRLDGSELLTPISSTATANNDERVAVSIKNHTAVVTGNLSSPAARTEDVESIGNQISEFEIVIADKVSVTEFDAQNARIEELRATDVTIKGTLDAANAEIEQLVAKDAEITGTLVANRAEIDDLQATKIDAELVAATYAEIGSLDALRIEVRDLDATFGDFQELTAHNFEAVNGTIENLDATYANIDFANITEAALEKIFADSGLIKDLVTDNGIITGELVGVTIKGSLIEAGTLKADKLVVKGSDGLYYKLNVEGGATTSSTVTEQDLQNGLHGDVIIAKSIAAEKISVTDLIAFGATIGGYQIDNNALRSVIKNNPLSTARGVYLGNDGQFAVGDTTHFIRLYEDENGEYKFELQADTITLRGRGTEGENVNIETELNSLLRQLSTLVQDSNGESLMTQGPDGWTFKTTGIQNSVETIFNNLGALNNSVGSTEQVVNILNQTVNDLKDTTEYIRIRVYEDEPCIELGESDSDLKLMVTNTRIMFLDSTGAVPTYLDRHGIVTDNIEVKSTIRQGNYSWILRPNGHLSLRWDANPALTYAVEHSLTNLTSSNEVLIATAGRTYKTFLVPDVGYEVNSVLVTMSEVDITAGSWDASTNKIEVVDVTGRIYVQATGSIINWSITENLTDVTSTSMVETVQYGTQYTDTLTILDDYIFGHVSITMGGEDVTEEVYDPVTGIINILRVIGNIIITAIAVLKSSTFTISNDLTNMISNNNTSSATAGDEYTAVLSVGAGHTIDSVSVVMGGFDITSRVYDVGTRVVSIPSITGDVVITAVANPTVYNVYNNLTHVNTSNYDNTATYGTSYNATLTAIDDYYIDSVTVSMGIVDVTSSVYNSSTGVINIGTITGDVVITAKAEPCRTILVSGAEGSDWIWAECGSLSRSGVANVNGDGYIITDIRPGTWTVKASKYGEQVSATVIVAESTGQLTYSVTMPDYAREYIIHNSEFLNENGNLVLISTDNDNPFMALNNVSITDGRTSQSQKIDCVIGIKGIPETNDTNVSYIFDRTKYSKATMTYYFEGGSFTYSNGTKIFVSADFKLINVINQAGQYNSLASVTMPISNRNTVVLDASNVSQNASLGIEISFPANSTIPLGALSLSIHELYLE